MQIIQSRRDFLASTSLAAAAGVFGARGSLADEGPPETTTIRLPFFPNICLAPGDIAGDLLRAEGFTDVRYIPDAPVTRGDIDFDFLTAAQVVFELDAGEPVTAVAGVHPGCYELFAHEPIRAISDLKGKKLGIYEVGGSGHLLLTTVAAQVGLDPHKDINWVVSPNDDAMELFVEGEVDAFLGFPPEPQELRARKIGRVILNMATDQPWSRHGRSIFAA
jgi:NitT/TauT family transport system substrate-binding protein